MVELEQIESVLNENGTAVVTTYRRDGRPQMSLVSVGRFEDGLAFTTRSRNAKAHNLKRDPRCAMMLVRPTWRGYVVVDGDADVRSRHNTDPEKLRANLRDVYRAAARKEHPNWAEYDQAMIDQDRVVVVLRPTRTVGVNV